MNAVVFGGGNIGRGLVAPVLHGAGYSITVVDADLDLIRELSAQKKFRLHHTDGTIEAVAITAAVAAQDEEAVVAAVAQADLIATAVGGAILPIVAPVIRDGLNESTRPAVNVIACENTHPNSGLLEEAMADDLTRGDVGFPEVVVDRIVIPAQGLDVSVEASFEFFVDAHQWVGQDPPEGIQLVDDIDAYLTRKLWLVNGLHATVAFEGLIRGYEFIHEAITHPAIAEDVGIIASNMVTVLADRHPHMSKGHLEATAAASLHRFADGSIADALLRVARNPLQKLSANERLLGPAVAADEMDLPIEAHGRAIATALSLPPHADVAGADMLRQALDTKGWRTIMEEEGVQPGSRLMEAIATSIESQGETVDTTIVESITILNPSGLHARPASIIVEHMKNSEATVTIQKGEKVANAASILSVLTLGASTGDEVTVSGEGEGAEAAVSFIKGVLISEEGE